MHASTSVIFASGCWCCTLAHSSFHLLSTQRHSSFVKCSHLKFTAYGQANRQTYMCLCNAVPLVWGSLRLTPIVLHDTQELDTGILCSKIIATVLIQCQIVNSSSSGGQSCWRGRQVSAKLRSLSIVCIQLGPRKPSIIWSRGVSTIQGLLKYWSEWKDSQGVQNCPLYRGCPLLRGVH